MAATTKVPSMLQTSLEHRDACMHAMADRLARILVLAELGLATGGAGMAGVLRDIRDLATPTAGAR